MTNGRTDGRIAALANAMAGTQSDSGGSANNSPSSSAAGARRRTAAPARPAQPPSRPTPGKIRRGSRICNLYRLCRPSLLGTIAALLVLANFWHGPILLIVGCKPGSATEDDVHLYTPPIR